MFYVLILLGVFGGLAYLFEKTVIFFKSLFL